MIIDKNTRSLEEGTFLRLEEEILDGRLKKGDVLTETALSKRLGVSRTPLRAALHTLAEEGLIELRANRGAVVIGVSPTDLANIYEIRQNLEGLATSLAIERMSEEDLTLLTESVELSEFYLGKRDLERLRELDTEFHRIIYRATQNRHLDRILTDLHRKIKVYRKLSLSVSERIEKSVREHREILEAIKKRDTSLAEQLTTKHVEAAMSNLLAIVE
jgi:DNA-binding GntR family transcriptional regulator